MITALDTNVLLDILIPNTRYVDLSERRLGEALTQGALVISEVVYAELACQFPTFEELDQFLVEGRIRLDSSRPEALQQAAHAWKRYLKRQGKKIRCPQCGGEQELICPNCQEMIVVRQHIIGDFLIGAHALIQADRLLTRDLGFYKSYFPRLVLLAP